MLSVCLPLCIPAVGPTSGGRIGPTFSHNTEYRQAMQHRSVVPIKIYPLSHDESLHPCLLAFLFDWWMKRWETAEEVSMNCTSFTYYVMLINGQTHMCLIAPCIKIITEHTAVIYRFKSARMVSVKLRLIWVFLGCDMPIQLVLSSDYGDWKIASSCTDSRHRLAMKYVTFHAWSNRFTRFSTCTLSIQLLLCVNKRLTTSIIKY